MTDTCRIPDCNQPASPDDPLGCCPDHIPDWCNDPKLAPLSDWLAQNNIAEFFPTCPVFHIHGDQLTYAAFDFNGPRDFSPEHLDDTSYDPEAKRTMPLLVAPSGEVKKVIAEAGGLLITDDLDLNALQKRLADQEMLKARLRLHATPEDDLCPVWPCDVAHNLRFLLPDEYPDGPGGISTLRRAGVAV